MNDLIEHYRQEHTNLKRFPGYSTCRHIDVIAALIRSARAKTLLDWGSGKGYQYLARRIHERWQGKPLPTCYDPAVPHLANKPEGRFDGVICCDVLEHIEEADIPAALAEIFGYAEKFVYLFVSTAPSKKQLADGRNCHVTVMPPEWWDERIAEVRGERPLRIVAEYGGGLPE